MVLPSDFGLLGVVCGGGFLVVFVAWVACAEWFCICGLGGSNSVGFLLLCCGLCFVVCGIIVVCFLLGVLIVLVICARFCVSFVIVC